MTTIQRFIRFNAVSAAGFAVQLVTVAFLSMALPDMAATGVAVAVAVVHNFLWHWRWTWGDRSAGRAGMVATFLRFSAANGAISLAGNILIVALVVRATGIDVVAANVVAVGVCGLLNYRIGDRLVFRARERESIATD